MAANNGTQRLFIVRHAETVENHTRIVQGQQDGTLSERGERQAEVLARYLRQFSFEKIVASDLGRVRQTLKPYLNGSSPEVQYTPLLRERSFGEIEGKSFREYQEVLSASRVSHTTFRPTDGENFHDVLSRARQFLADLELQPGYCLLVTHGGMVRSLMAALLDKPIEEMLSFPIENTSITVFERSPEQPPKLVERNRTLHIEEASEVSALGLDVHAVAEPKND